MESKKRKLANFGVAGIPRGLPDFTDAASLRKLTTLTLLNEYGLRMELPENVLCPPVPNRLNYLHWLKSMLHSLLFEDHDGGTVLDVGVGASCVYPLLGNKLFGWRFLGSDIEPEALSCARRNADLNEGGRDIRLVLAPSSEALQAALLDTSPNLDTSPASFISFLSAVDARDASLRGPVRAALAAAGGAEAAALLNLELRHGSVTPAQGQQQGQGQGQGQEQRLLLAVLCNPPFYGIDEAVLPNPRTACTGSVGEMRTLGGELCFALGMVLDSIILGRAVGLYSCLLGKKRSATALVNILRALSSSSPGAAAGGGGAELIVCSARLEQGRTHRWVVAWCFAASPSSSSSSSSSSSGGARRGTAPSPTFPAFNFAQAQAQTEAQGREGGEGGEGRAQALCLRLGPGASALSDSEIVSRAEESLREQGLGPGLGLALSVSRSSPASSAPASASASAPGSGSGSSPGSGSGSSPGSGSGSGLGSAPGKDVALEMRGAAAGALDARAMDRLRGDVERCNRRWRRRLQLQPPLSHQEDQ